MTSVQQVVINPFQYCIGFRGCCIHSIAVANFDNRLLRLRKSPQVKPLYPECKHDLTHESPQRAHKVFNVVEINSNFFLIQVLSFFLLHPRLRQWNKLRE